MSMNISSNPQNNAIARRIFLFLCLLLVWPLTEAQGVEVIYQGLNTSIYEGVPLRDCEFENPLSGDEDFDDEPILDWRDADFHVGSPNDYEDWVVSDMNDINGCDKEIWLRNEGHTATTTTLVASDRITVNLNGDANDGLANVHVDGVLVATLDMYSKPKATRVVILVENLTVSTHEIVVTDMGPGYGGGDDVAIFGVATLPMNPEDTVEESTKQAKSFWDKIFGWWPFSVTAFKVSNPRFVPGEDLLTPPVGAEIYFVGIEAPLPGPPPAAAPTAWAQVNEDDTSPDFLKEAWYYFEPVAMEEESPRMGIAFALPDMPLSTLDGMTGWYLIDYEVYSDSGLEEQGTMSYRLGPLPVGGVAPTPGEGRVMLSVPRQDQNYPNPFNPVTTIRYHLPRTAEVDLTIYDLRGNRIRHLPRGSEAAGTHQVVWDGRADDGCSVPAGTYLSVLAADEAKVTRKIVLLK